MDRFMRLGALALTKALQRPVDPSELEIPPDMKLGDVAYPCFKLAKEFRLSPAEVAKKLASDLVEKQAVPPGMQVQAAGPYLNFILPARETFIQILGDILKGPGLGSYGSLAAKSRGSWVLEFSSPNVAKPMNIYHLRPTALGAALDRIGRYRGFDVVSINHLGDWGTQYGKLAVAYKLFGSNLPADPSIDDLVSIYVKFHAEAETNPALEVEAREAFARLERDDPEMLALWDRCREISLKEFNRIYAMLGVHFDHIWGESFYRAQLAPLLTQLRTLGLLVQSEGAWVVPVTDLDGKVLPPCILEKSDGATIYATRDVAAAIYRFGKFKFDRMTYIVGSEQRLHFKQVFSVLRKMGLEWATRCEHVPFGLYRFKDAKMSTRKGNFITLESVLNEAVERVLEIMRAKPERGAAERPTALAIAIGAVVFHDLHTDPIKDVEFDLERVVDFEGETGPYLQYAHTRCVSILRKAADAGLRDFGFDESSVGLLQAPQELALAKTLAQFPIHLERTLKFAKASQLAHYMIDVTKAFGSFYRECQVLGDDPQLSRARLMLVEASRRVLAQGLGLLGIPLPERM